jgi:hypothetical protein
MTRISHGMKEKATQNKKRGKNVKNEKMKKKKISH